LYHQKKEFISVPYEPKSSDYLKRTEEISESTFAGDKSLKKEVGG
jgi:hypothetical protein